MNTESRMYKIWKDWGEVNLIASMAALFPAEWLLTLWLLSHATSWSLEGSIRVLSWFTVVCSISAVALNTLWLMFGLVIAISRVFKKRIAKPQKK